MFIINSMAPNQWDSEQNVSDSKVNYSSFTNNNNIHKISLKNNNNNNNNRSETNLNINNQQLLPDSGISSDRKLQQQHSFNQQKSITISNPVNRKSSIQDFNLTGGSTTVTGKNEHPEKEKKKKELSSSRQKKFHRHFQQVPRDEKVLNYFSCALVSDILLQGHLYITQNYFAFYSNVFGFVTKLVIPTSSVIKISKEKTAKIIPNAIGVATIDERHVFGSFMSREAAYRLMCSVCPPLDTIKETKIVDVENFEESIEDESSCSISGNESPPHLLESTGISTGGCSATTGSSDASQSLKFRPPLTSNSDSFVNKIQTEKFEEIASIKNVTQPILAASSVLSQTPVKTAISPKSNTEITKISKSVATRLKYILKFKFPSNFHVVYMGIILTLILTLFSGFLMYKILQIEAKSNYRTIDFTKMTPDDQSDGGSYSETFKWQKELQSRSIEEAQILLNTNLKQIAKVRKSLETLSILIHDQDKNPTSHYHQPDG